jgi:hypothetical protein
MYDVVTAVVVVVAMTAVVVVEVAMTAIVVATRV